MWPSQQVQPGYPYQRQNQNQNPPPPLAMPQHVQQQQFGYEQQPQIPHYPQSSYDMPHPSSSIPPSPREEAGKEKDVDYTNLPGPAPIFNEWHGYVYVLEWVQQPIRARMCGFGDKDRRPISPPPCIRLMVMDKASGKEVDPSTIDISFFILTVDLWDKEGQSEKNLVKHAQVSPSISTATTTSYPATFSHTPPTHAPTQPFNLANLPGYQSTNTQSGTGYGYPPGPSAGNGQPQMYGNRYGDNQYNGQGYDAAQSGYGMPPSNGYNFPPISSFQSGTPVPSPYGQARRNYRDDDLNSPQTTGMFTRNLIGSLSTSASLLRNEKQVLGIWFILQDLSVRTEDWFRLKASFVNLGEPANPQMQMHDRLQQAQVLTKGTAPVLATIFSKPFQVFSAKKFPGVIESTELSKEFAKQGVKIPIRKENGGKARRPSNDEEDFEEE